MINVLHSVGWGIASFVAALYVLAATGSWLRAKRKQRKLTKKEAGEVAKGCMLFALMFSIGVFLITL